MTGERPTYKSQKIMNQTSKYEFTVIVPVYNEEDNMERLETELSKFTATAPCPSCVLFVNDGSKDTSLVRIEGICKRQKHFFYISFQRNCGLSAAMKAGIDYAESEFVGYIDADLQTTPEDFPLLLAHRNEAPLVMGIRANRKDTAFKRLQSKIANGFRRFMTKDKAKDTGCPLKVMRTGNARKVPFFTGMHRFLPALFLLQGADMVQIPVRHFPRQAGVSKYHLFNRLVSPFMDCFAYRWMKKRYIDYTVEKSNL